MNNNTTYNYAGPFDILFRDFFQTTSTFSPTSETKATHPLDIYEDPDGLHFEIACTGLTKADVDINIHEDILKFSYDKPTEEARNYIHKGIAKRSFDLGYKIAGKFNLQKASAEMENGLLQVHIPFAESSKPTTLTIK